MAIDLAAARWLAADVLLTLGLLAIFASIALEDAVQP